MENKKDGIIGLVFLGVTLAGIGAIIFKTVRDTKKTTAMEKAEAERKLREEEERRQQLEDYKYNDMTQTNYNEMVRHISIDNSLLDHEIRKKVFAVGMKYIEQMKDATTIEYYDIYKNYILSLNEYAKDQEKLSIFVDYSIEKMNEYEANIRKEKEHEESVKMEQMRIHHEEEMKRLENKNLYETQLLSNARDNKRLDAALAIAKTLKNPEGAISNAIKLL